MSSISLAPLIEPLLPNLRRYAQVLTRDADGAADLVQSCVTRALAKQHLWHEGTNLRAWLFVIMRNIHRSELRKRFAVRRGLSMAAPPSAMMPRSDPEMSYLLGEVQNALERLPAWQKEVLLQIALDERRYDHVAAELGIPIGTVRSRLSRARQRLRDTTSW